MQHLASSVWRQDGDSGGLAMAHLGSEEEENFHAVARSSRWRGRRGEDAVAKPPSIGAWGAQAPLWRYSQSYTPSTV